MVKKKNSSSAQNDELLFRTSSNFDKEKERERKEITMFSHLVNY
jgi:hypothetical protein